MSVTQEQIQDAIKCGELHHFRGTTHIVCCLTLQNGYTVIGQSAASDPAEFDLNLGAKFAKEDAESKVAELLAYIECEKRTVQ